MRTLDDPFAPLRLAALPAGRALAFDAIPDSAQRQDISRRLGLDGLESLRLAGRLVPEGRRDWRLEARLSALVVQPCVVTLTAVTSPIDEVVTRVYREGAPLPENAPPEAEMPEDDTVEPLPETLDLGAVLEEALALALPAYPRAPGAALGEKAFAPPGAAPLDAARPHPFAGLAGLAGKLSDGGETPDDGTA